MRISDWSSDVCSSDLISERMAVFLMQYPQGTDVDHDALRHDCPELFDADADAVAGAFDGQTPQDRAQQALQACGGNRQEAARRQIGRAWCRERVWQYV